MITGMMYRVLIFFIYFILILPSSTYAQAQGDIQITEIFYDREGGDHGYEWIEIYNAGSESIDLSSWYFYEQEVFHRLEFEASSILQPSSYAVIVQDRELFKSEFTTTALVIKSSFSLHNTGEELGIYNQDKVESHSYTYHSEIGAAGDGMSIQYISGNWEASVPTPGKSNSQQLPSDESSVPSEASTSSDTIDDRSKKEKEEFQNYYEPYIVFPDIITVDSSIRIQAGVYYVEEKKRTRALKGSYYLNLGDGRVLQEEERIDTEIIFNQPGEYILSFEYNKNTWPNNDGIDEPDVFYQKRIVVESQDVSIDGYAETGGLVLRNNESFDIDLGGWSLHSPNHHYRFPKYTFIKAQSLWTLDNRIFGIFVHKGNIHKYTLINERGVVIDHYMPEESDTPALSIVDTLYESENDIVLGEQVVHVSSLDEVIEVNNTPEDHITNDESKPSKKPNIPWLIVALAFVTIGTRILIRGLRSLTYPYMPIENSEE
jgi:hypothetical protein